jgi:DNA-binding NtrC family response regulator
MGTILVLDDDQVILDLLQTVLTDAGHVTILATGPEAIPESTSADLVITDLVPFKAYRREAALEWVASLRKRFAGSPVFVITAHSLAASEPDKLGAHAVITKPFDVEVLLRRIDEALNQTSRHMRNTP